MSRALGPHRPNAKSDPVRSVMRTRSPSPICAAQPRQVVGPAATARDHPEQLLVLADHREVEADPAAPGECRGVDDRAHGPLDPVREDTLEVRERVGPLDVELRERRDVEEGGVRAGGEVLGAHLWRPAARGPTCAPSPLVPHTTHPIAVRSEPLRALPPRTGEELGAEGLVAGEERGEPEVARLRRLLERVDDVVYLAILLRAALAHVRG